MIPDADAVIEAFGKNEQIKKMSWTVFVAMVGLMPEGGVDPVTAQQSAGMITGRG